MFNLTPLQWIGIILVINGALDGSINEMTDLLGVVWAKHVVSIATIGSAVCGGLVTLMGSQGAQIRTAVASPEAQESMIKAVLAMPGVEKLTVNSQANSTLATVAVDAAQAKIEPIPEAKAAVTATAQAAS